ncbi:MAG: hypothetical protein WC816_12005 [Sphingomonas sp.]|jgi:hypothetical protein
MLRFASFAAILGSALLVSASPVLAQPAGYYVATPAAAPTKDTLITQGTLWKCADGVCVANKAPMRDAILCQLVAQNVGALTSFSSAGTALDANALAKCNAHAH